MREKYYSLADKPNMTKRTGCQQQCHYSMSSSLVGMGKFPGQHACAARAKLKPGKPYSPLSELPCSLPMLHLICLHASMHQTRKRLQRHGRGGAHVQATQPWPTSFNAFPSKDMREHAAAEYMGVAWLCCGMPARETT